MSQFGIDYSALDTTVNKRAYKLSDVADRLEKVAFDIVRFKDGDFDELWQIQNADDGQYIVARYETEVAEAVEKTAAERTWDVLVAHNDISIFYKGQPVVKLSALQLGVPVGNLPLLQRFLPIRLNTDKALVKALLNDLSATAKHQLLKTYPELA